VALAGRLKALVPEPREQAGVVLLEALWITPFVLWSQRDYNNDSETDSRKLSMSAADTYVRARIDTDTKERAADALEAMGLSISDAIRLLMLRIADERRLPFDVKVPNATTRKAIAELEAGKGKRFASVDELMADLHADD
jgi:DNA-damage-inducible protein J